MLSDLFGSQTSLTNPEAVEAWNATQMAFLAHGAATPEHLGRTLTLAPDFAMAHATKGLFLLLLGRRVLLADAEAAHARAAALVAEGAVPLRERRYVAALGHYLAGFPSRAAAEFEAVRATDPQDAMAAKLAHAIHFVLGDSARLLSVIERVLPAIGPDHPAHGFMLGCRAFGLEETGAFAAALTSGERALTFRPDDAWGLHAATHVYDMTAESRRGLECLDRNEAAWAHCNNFRFHVWWHKALLHLDQGEVDAVFALYDTKVRAEKTDDYRDISNATSLLTRLELEGHDVGDRWEELAAISDTHLDDGCLLFADLHYMLALLGDGRTQSAGALAARVSTWAELPGGTDAARVYAHPGQAGMAGLCAFSEGDYATAFHHLSHASQGMRRAGGSHAQRDVFERVAIDAGLRAGALDGAAMLLDARRSLRGGHDDRFARTRSAMIAEARTHAAPAA